MSRYHCINEEKELQDLLEAQPELLPGEQIKPEDQRRWLLVKREMPVQDPNSFVVLETTPQHPELPLQLIWAVQL